MIATFAMSEQPTKLVTPANGAPALQLDQLLSCAPVLALQPIHGAGYRWSEVLLRPSHATPEAMVEQAALTGRSALLDLHIAMTALALMETDHCYSLNISPLSLVDPQFTEQLLDAAWSQDRIGRHLVVEVLEWPQLSPAQSRLACQSLKLLRSMRIRVALDDVGYRPHPISFQDADILKVDCSLVAALREPGTRTRATLELIRLARLGLPIVAEGVESKADLDRVQALGIPLWQGHWGGSPQPWEAMP